jgi:AAA ATPase domain
VARKAGPVGRDDVLAELRRVMDEAVAGRGRLLLLAGEAGIGKTTMLTAAAALAESRGIRVAWGWGWPGEGAPGYWPWIQVMRMLGLDIPWPAEDSGQPAGDAPASERFRLFDEVTSLLLAESRIQRTGRSAARAGRRGDPGRAAPPARLSQVPRRDGSGGGSLR